MQINIIKNGDLVFDVGANVGNKTKEFMKLGARVVAFEPQSDCIACLSKTGATVRQVALGKEKSDMEFLFKSNANTLSSMSEDFIVTVKQSRFKDYNWGNVEQVKTETLDNMIGEFGTPKYIKIDVEGYELEVLKGLTKPVEFISFEFTPELLGTALRCLDYLPTGKYNYSSQESGEFKFDKWVDKEPFIEFLKGIKDYQIEFGDIYVNRIIS